MSRKGTIVSVLFLTLTLASVCNAGAATTVSLNAPDSGQVFTGTNNVTFNCSVTNGDYIRWLSFYSDINGAFALNRTEYFGELAPDSSMPLLMHFNNESAFGENDARVHDWSGNGNNGTVYDATVNSSGGKYLGAFEFDGLGSRIDVRDANTLDVSEGTIEAWIKPKDSSDKPKTFIVAKNGATCDDSHPYAMLIDDQGRIAVEIGVGGYQGNGVSGVNWDEWNHVAVVWNSTGINYYLNGNLDYSEPVSLEFVSNSENITIGANMPGCSFYSYGFPFNGTIDELAIYNRVLSGEEIGAHYNRTFPENASTSWNVTDIPDGTYKWSCMSYDNNSQSTWAASNSTFYVDNYSPPDVTGITLSPSSADEQDPGVTINVTANITDPSNVSSVVFQYKNCSLCSWTNDTMANASNGEWVASLATISEPTTYYYRILSNDTLGHFGNTSTYNISVAFDYTWTVNDSELGIESEMVNGNKTLGIIAINNTGDYSLTFTLADNWNDAGICGQTLPVDCEVYYNGSTTYQFSLPSKTVGHVNISALFENRNDENNFTINITAEPYDPSKTAQPVSRSMNISMNSYTGGPYFNVYVVSPPATVYQSQAFNLTARMKNIGNETANNTVISWGLPSGWDVSGSESVAIGNMTPGNTSLSSITVTIDPNTVIPTTYVIYANVTCYQSVNGSAQSPPIGVSCSGTDGVCGAGCSYVTDSDCSIPQSPGGGTTLTSIAGIAKEYDIGLIAPSRIDVNRGETQTIKLGVKNNISGTSLRNIYLHMSGYMQTFLNSSPAYIDDIAYGETKYFELEVRAPIYAAYAEYRLNITVNGKFSEGEKSTGAEKNTSVLLVTHKLINNEIMAYIEITENALGEMTGLGMETSQISAMLDEMKKAMDEGNYYRVSELSDEVAGLRESALRVMAQINETESEIENIRNQNFALPESEKMLSLTKSALMRGDYAKAEERLSSTMLVFAVESGNAGIWIFVAKYWLLMASLAMAGVAGAVLTRKRLMVSSLNKKLGMLKIQEKAVHGLMEDLQREHFVEKKMSIENYENGMEKYENGLAEINKERVDIFARLSAALKPKEAARLLADEEKMARDVMVDMQKKYFGRGMMDKEHYKRMMKSLRWELLELKSMKEMTEDGKA